MTIISNVKSDHYSVRTNKNKIYPSHKAPLLKMNEKQKRSER